MAFSATTLTAEPRSFGIGPIKIQVMSFTAASGDTSGTVTASQMHSIDSVILGDTGMKFSALPTVSGNVATLAFVVPTTAAASKVVQDLTYTADATGYGGNSITIAYTAGATAGSEVVTVTGNAISVQIETGVSTATQVKTAVEASGAAAALVDITVSGTGSAAQVTAAAVNLANGVTGGALGTLVCIGH